MVRILKFAKHSWASMVLIVMLLVIQANCELKLPEYTSDIVDVGIQQGGIDDSLPTQMREETFAGISHLPDQTAVELFQSSYEKESDGYLHLKADVTEDEKSAMRAAIESMALTMAKAQMGEEAVSDMMAKQLAVAFVKMEYEAMGLNVHQIQMQYLLRKGGQMLLLSILGMAVAILVSLLASRVAARTGKELRGNVFRKVTSFSNTEMDHFSTASLITRSTNDIQQVQMVQVMLLRMVAYAPIMGIGGIVKVLNTNTSMTWIIALAVAAILALVLILMKIAMPKFKRMPEYIDDVNLVTREILTGLPVIRAFSREKHEEERFDKASRTLMKNQLFTNRVMTFMMPAMMFIMNGVTVLIVWAGAKGIDMGTLQVGDMMAFISYTMQIIMSFLMLTMMSIMLPRAAVSADRIEEILKTEPVITDKTEPKTAEITRGEVAFSQVNFRYPNADEDALSDITFTAKPGETTAIIGSTGCGKSTLVHLIPRLYDITGGALTIDGVPVGEYSQHTLRDAIGFVPQKGVLFSGTIASNLRFGSENASKEEMAVAARIAQAEEFIETKPEKFDTEIAQGGTNVSGGQKQRLSIARAIVKKPPIYIFDDSFSALDYKTDVALRQALAGYTKDSTVIIVAQRISTILHADKIIVLDEGKIAGIGTHKELLQDNEIYRQIATSQLSKEELESTSGKETC